jgi:phage terminase large subunit
MQFIISFNPVSELNWLKNRFFDDVTDTAIIRGEEEARYTKQDISKCNTLIIHSTYKDNCFIDPNYEKELNDLLKYDPDEYNVYCLGQWGIPGGGYFDKHSLNKRIKEVQKEKPIKQGYFEFDWNDPDSQDKIIDSSIKWVDDEQGYIKIYEEPQKGYPYCAGGDTAGEGSDWNVGYFTNNITNDDVAILRVNFDEDLYAQQMYCLGRYYNNALLGIETNFSTHPQKELERLRYAKLYIRAEEPDKISGQLQKRYGFQTNKATRPLALGMLRTMVREHPERIKDLTTLQEMSTFVKNEKGKPEAADGNHDDCIMARAIDVYVSEQQSHEIIKEPETKQKKLLEQLGIKKNTDKWRTM